MSTDDEGIKYIVIEAVRTKVDELKSDYQEMVKHIELLEQAYGNYVKKTNSKISYLDNTQETIFENVKTNNQRIAGFSMSVAEISSRSAQALSKAIKTSDEFSKLWLKIFISIIGATLLSQGIMLAAVSILMKTFTG